nr:MULTISPECIES: site-specific integrase [unclassified Leucobacter]
MDSVPRTPTRSLLRSTSVLTEKVYIRAENDGVLAAVQCPRDAGLDIERSVVSIGSKLIEGTPKSHKIRRVPVQSIVWDLLKEHCADRKPHELIFGNAYGTFVSPPSGGRSGRNWYNSALTRANLRQMRVHDLRHTAASLAVQAGANVKEVQRMLGHKSAAITLDIYADLFDEDFTDLISRLDHQIASTVVVNSVAKGKPETEKDPHHG